MLLNPEELVLPPVRIPEDMLPHEKVGSHTHESSAAGPRAGRALCHPDAPRCLQQHRCPAGVARHCRQVPNPAGCCAQVAIRGLADLVVQCTAFSPDHRPSFAAILQVPSRTARPSEPPALLREAQAATPMSLVQQYIECKPMGTPGSSSGQQVTNVRCWSPADARPHLEHVLGGGRGAAVAGGGVAQPHRGRAAGPDAAPRRRRTAAAGPLVRPPAKPLVMCDAGLDACVVPG